MINKEQHIGKIYSSKNYGSFIITDYDGCNRVTIRFLTTQYETVASLDNIRIGNVRDKLVPSVFGGVVGVESFYSVEYSKGTLQEYVDSLLTKSGDPNV